MILCLSAPWERRGDARYAAGGGGTVPSCS